MLGSLCSARLSGGHSEHTRKPRRTQNIRSGQSGAGVHRTMSSADFDACVELQPNSFRLTASRIVRAGGSQQRCPRGPLGRRHHRSQLSSREALASCIVFLPVGSERPLLDGSYGVYDHSKPLGKRWLGLYGRNACEVSTRERPFSLLRTNSESHHCLPRRHPLRWSCTT